jgi:RNA polymerase sigma-70 factor (sigma-E family)
MAEDDEMAAFCRTHHPRLYGAMLLHTRDRAEAEDLAQEALVRAVERWSTVSRMESPDGWLFRVAFNLAHSRGRRRALWPKVRRRLVAAGAVESGPRDLDLARALSRLSERQRAAVVLRHYLDRSVRETALVLACSEGTVKALTHQGIESLRRSIGSFTDENEGATHDDHG